MISINVIMLILLVHWFADFHFQSDEMAKGKSTSWTLLTQHVVIYTFTWIVWSFALFETWKYPVSEIWIKCGIFAGVTFFFHWITDFFTSKIVKAYFDKGDHHNGFVVIGFDQILHYTQLFITYIWLRDLAI